MPYDHKTFPYVAPPGLTGQEPRHKVIVVGAGPVGLSIALDLAGRGIPSVVLDDGNTVAAGSRAIGWSRRSLHLFDRLGIADKVLEKAVPWSIGRVCHGDDEVCDFDLESEPGNRLPVFANLQQYYVEEFLAERALAEPLIDLRFRNRATSVDDTGDEAHVTVRTPDGRYGLSAEYVLACDGARSTMRAILDLDFEGEMYEERFLIADIEMAADFPAERWFWFDPTFHDGQSALLQRQADNIYRLDLQLGPDADAAQEARPENVIPRIEKLVGPDFELEWVSVYKFQCRRLHNFVHGRVIFLGDSAHLVPPYGARGGNGGLQDVENLGWKLAAVLDGRAPERLIDSYDRERVQAAEADIRQSTAAARFITPAAGVERLFRDQVLGLARKADFARGWVNSGRLSHGCVYDSAGPDDALLPPMTRPGAVVPDVPQGNGWLFDRLGEDVTLLALNGPAPKGVPVPCLEMAVTDKVRAQFLGDAPRALYLLRPDRVIAARWVECDAAQVNAALAELWEGRL
ncbi:2-polyprenyl-6-methoxyphenol hydroxylase and related FAD-dependent oxidoreductase [Rhodovulum sp. P5]|uniref:FAD-dependent monooxygenase n=1 Tax=Rhodovulum sp. P5 TaxID=1564506 RepID=UPI0009C37A96|nr:FAD-dependent monooxygenase [Rhodovulum sp. P5]ARE40478.1 2-polyprenyl-6-methoxyphenol hydroxylase and related FAD-dependent oxidoreductase [Rhodovulum sp. P5]